MRRSTCSIVVGLVVALFLLAPSAPAQVTTGTVMGQVVQLNGSRRSRRPRDLDQRGAREQKRPDLHQQGRELRVPGCHG